MSNFSFSHSVFKRLVSQGCQKVSLCGNGLNPNTTNNQLPSDPYKKLSTPKLTCSWGRYHQSFLRTILTCYQTIPTFNDLENDLLLTYLFPKQALVFYVSAAQVFWKHCGKRRNCSELAISPFPTMFSIHLENFLPFSSISKLSSANSFNLEV